MSIGREQRVAKRYAKALFDVTPPTDFDRTEEQLKRLARVWDVSADFRESLSNPRVTESARLTVVNAVVENLGGWVTQPAQKTIAALVSYRKGRVLPALAEIFASLVSEYKKSLLLEVTLAQPASGDTLTQLQQKLASSLGGEVKISVKTDPSLIGGMTVRLGDTLLDRSIAGTLQRVAGQLAR